MLEQKDIDDIIELKAHFDPNHPIHRLCDVVVKMSTLFMTNENVAVDEVTDNGDTD